MDFPLKELIDGLGFPVYLLLLMLLPVIVGAIIAQVLRLIRNFFGKGEDD